MLSKPHKIRIFKVLKGVKKVICHRNFEKYGKRAELF